MSTQSSVHFDRNFRVVHTRSVNWLIQNETFFPYNFSFSETFLMHFLPREEASFRGDTQSRGVSDFVSTTETISRLEFDYIIHRSNVTRFRGTIGTRMIQQRISTVGQLGWAYGRSYLCSQADSWSDSWRITVIACLWSLTSSWSHNYPAWRPIPSAGPTVRARLYAYVYVFAGTSDAARTSARAYVCQGGGRKRREAETESDADRRPK